MRKKHEAYSYHVTFNAMHNLVLDDPKRMHAHTFRVGMYVIEKQDEHPVFLNNEKILQNYFKRYRGVRINELPVFKDVIPTLENMGTIFYEDLKAAFAENGMELLSLEIGDSPISAYCIGEKLLLGSIFNLTDEDEVDRYCQRVRQRYETMQRGEQDNGGC